MKNHSRGPVAFPLTLAIINHPLVHTKILEKSGSVALSSGLCSCFFSSDGSRSGSCSSQVLASSVVRPKRALNSQMI